jgi:hypothetical protein
MNSAPKSDSDRHPTTLLCNHYLPLKYFIIHLLFEHYTSLQLLEYFTIQSSRRMQNGLK